MQLTQKMKLAEAKQFVATKLKIGVTDLTNEEITRQLREDLGIGLMISVAGSPKGMRAKLKVAELLGVRINSVELFKSQLG